MTTLSPLTPDDIPEVMRIERLPGYEAFIGRFEADEHAAQFASPEARYFGLRNGDRLDGFVILQEFTAPTILLRRIAVAEPEGGRGTALLRQIMDWVFQETPAEALKLGVALGNSRAKHVYEREGFHTEGVDEAHHLMRITKARWAELRGNS
ncbi:GNAT family N-acetyltransferase [Phenylobacterium sp.]|uniref:GNAT family N-acetyltransferase n=1 Tax=Phenylobacterium sp. TaxID=1871053 RepID=UPI0028113F92|nr:GNAT family N-acetyltransferase [Phenylobacterium sp.]